MFDFVPNRECDYRFDYQDIFADIADGKLEMIPVFRTLIKDDLWFILNFIMAVPNSNRPFIVDACKEVESGADGWTMDLWARGHWKSSILTKARTIQRIVKYPEKSTMIASHTRPIAKKFLRPIMLMLETNDILKACFPSVLYGNPRAESPKWSEDDGLVCKRQGTSRSEATVEAWGLIEGMPISVHFDWIIMDDLETKDSVTNPDVVNKIRSTFDLTIDLLTEGGSISVVGTPYSHNGIYIPFVRDKVKANGEPKFQFRRKPATKDGTINGEPVLLSKEELDDIRAGKGEYEFASQQMINPTPTGVRKLEGRLIKDIEAKLIPKSIQKFMVIDPAGDDKTGKGDAWAFMVVGVEPKSDEIGASRIFITDAIISPMREEEAPEDIARMYLRNGMIMQVGVEKVGISTAEIHVANALAKKGRYISQENGTLMILRPGGRNNRERIEKALPWPMYNDKIFISNAVPQVYRNRLRDEADQSPYWHDDGLTCLAYFYDMIADYRFGWFDDEDDTEFNQPRQEMGRNAVTGY